MFIGFLLLATSFSIDEDDRNYNGFNKDETYTSVSCDALDEVDADNPVFPLTTKQFAGCRGFNKKTVFINSNIASYAFLDSDIQKVTLMSNVNTIGVGAFSHCESLESINFDNKNLPSYLQINEGAFYGALLDNDFTLQSFVSSVGNYAFAKTSIKSLTISSRTSVFSLSLPEGAFYDSNVAITQIPADVSLANNVFENCKNVKTLTYNGGSIGNEAFLNCDHLTSINFGRDCSATSIGQNAFKGTGLNSAISFPIDLDYIYDYAFAGTGITSITFNNKLKIIYEGAFKNCKSLGGSLTLSDDLNTIGDYAFAGTAITGLVVKDKVWTINEGAFKDCKSLTGDLDLQSVRTIGPDAFYGCILDGTLSLDKVNSIGENAFRETQVKGTFVLSNSLSLIDEYAFYKTKVTSLTIKDTGSGCEIKGCAFSYCQDKFTLISIEGPITIYNAFMSDTITTLNLEKCDLRKEAFNSTTFEEPVIIKDSLIGDNAFGFAKIPSISIQDPASRQYSDEAVKGNAFYKCEIKNHIDLIDVSLENNAFKGLSKTTTPNVTFYHDEDFPESTKLTIGSNAFEDTSIIGVNEITDRFSSVGDYAFSHCKELKGPLVINASTISDHAFSHCNFNKLTIGNQVETFSYSGNSYSAFEGNPLASIEFENTGVIPERAFYKMTSLNTEIYIPHSISSIQTEAFLGCTEIKALIFEPHSNSLTIQSRAFYGCAKIPSLDVQRTLTSFSTASFCKCINLASVVFPLCLTSIGNYAFSETGLTSVNFNHELTSIGYAAFKDCKNLNGNLVIPNHITTINKRVFYGCPFRGGTLTAGYQLASIDDYAFYQCQFTGGLYLPRVTSVGKYAFYGCSEFNGNLILYEQTLLDSTPETNPVTVTVDESAFEGCSKLTGTLPLKYIASIGDKAFSGCSSVTGQLDFYAGLSLIPDYAFYECIGLTGPIYLPKPSPIPSPPTFYIGKYAFSGCTGLDGTLELNDNLLEIKDYAFNGCYKISGQLNIPSELTKIHDGAFNGCSGFSGPLEIPETVIKIGKSAFAGCSGFSNSLTINVGTESDPLVIGREAFKGCTGFKDGVLSIFVNQVDDDTGSTNRIAQYYRYDYFLRIGNEAFEKTKFKNVYYSGRFQPDCDYDIGISGTKGIKTSTDYANKSFCGNPIHHSKLNGGAIAGIVIACIVVVAIIVFLIVFFILKNKKNKDKSEGEVEMNGD